MREREMLSMKSERRMKQEDRTRFYNRPGNASQHSSLSPSSEPRQGRR